MIDPGLLTELKEAVTALMVITIIASVYGGIKSKEIEGALSITFVFASVFTIALWATTMLGLELASTGNMIVFYIAVIWAGIVIILLAFTLGFVVAAIIAFNEVSAMRSLIAAMRIWPGRGVRLWLPVTIVRAIADELEEERRRLLITAYIYSIITAVYGFCCVFIIH